MNHLDLILNLSLLIALSVISCFIQKRYPQTSRWGPPLQGILFGGVAVIGMLDPVVVGPGLIFDGRSIMVSLCALFYGPWAAGVSVAIALPCRMVMGGAGIIMGTMVILSSALVGLVARSRFKIEDQEPSAKELYLFGLAVHAAMLAMTITLPHDQAGVVFRRIAFPVILFYPLATILAGKILTDHLSNVRFVRQLQEARDSLTITLQSIGDAIISTDPKGNILLMNPVAENLTGWSYEDARNRPLTEIFNIVNANTRTPVENPVGKVLTNGKSVGLANHTMLIARDGREYPIADSAAPIYDTEGCVKGVVMVFRDVTDEYQRVEALRRSEALFRKIFEDHAAVKLLIDPENQKIIDANHAAEKFYGWPREQLRRMTIGQINTAPSPVLDQEVQRARSEAQIKFEFCHRLADGSTRDVEVFSSKITVKEKELLHSIVHDVTQRKQAERSLVESENRYRSIIMHSPDAVFVNDQDHVVLVNHACQRLFGADSAEALIGKSIYALFHEDCHEQIRKRIDQLRNENQPVPLAEEQIVRMDGGVVDVDVIEAPFDVDASRHIHVILRDITPRKQKEAELNRLLAAIEQLDEMIVITDVNAGMVYVNPAFERVTGYSIKEVIGRNPRILKSGEQDAAFYTQLWRTITAGETWKGQLVNRRKDGSRYTESLTISPVSNDSGRIVNFVAVKRDITDEIELGKRLQQAQKMEAIGTLSSGIAHDFNNLLFPIVGMSEILLDDLPPDNINRPHVEQIYQAGMRASDLVKQILSFSRQASQEKLPLRVQSVLKEVMKLARSTLPANIRIDSHIQTDCGMVLMDATQLHQIAMNLITNAYHAMEENGGDLTIGLEEVVLNGDHPLAYALSDGKYARMSFADTGYGIAPSVISKIFEPYFTTKPQGKGTGMGLSIVYGIVKEAGGEIKVESDVGQGTSIEIYIPILENVQGESSAKGAAIAPTGMERILLVDDELAIMRMEKRMLERLGYDVTARSSSQDALEAFRKKPGAFDVVLTDMMMPNMTGEQLARAIHAIDPNVPVIICTGFSDRINAEAAPRIGIKAILMKPVAKFDLANAIRKVLDARPTS